MKQGKRAAGAISEIIGATVFTAALALVTASCDKGSAGQGSQVQSSEVPAPGEVSVGARLAAPASSAPALPGSFDSCLVGSWKTTQVVLRREQVAASGGAGIALDIKPTGAVEVDFGEMSLIAASAPPTSFEYSYAGKATATLSTPSAGVCKVDGVEYSKVKVTAKVSLPGAGAVELFKNTPLTDLEKLGKAAAKAEDDLPLPETAGPGQQAIDPAPILSSTSYSCAAEKLELKGPPGSPTWQFERVR